MTGAAVCCPNAVVAVADTAIKALTKSRRRKVVIAFLLMKLGNSQAITAGTAVSVAEVQIQASIIWDRSDTRIVPGGKLKSLSLELQANSRCGFIEGHILYQRTLLYTPKSRGLSCFTRRRLFLGVHPATQNHDGRDLIDDILAVLPSVSRFVENLVGRDRAQPLVPHLHR